MNPPTYTPRAGSLASQVISFFRNNPDEELLLDDITDKFAATRGNVHTLLSDAVKAELLARERGYTVRIFNNETDALVWLRHGMR